MFPISDDNPRTQTPVVTWAIIGACVLVYLWQASLGQKGGQLAVYQFGMIPARLFGNADLPAELAAVPAWTTLFSSMFMHGGWLHLGLNMLFLWIFGDNVEESMGHLRYLLFYIACGVAAALAQAFVSPASNIPMVGASGAISGVLGAYALLHPRATVRVLVILGLFVTIAHIPAALMLGIWFLMQIGSAILSTGNQPGVAFWAHIGGFVAGLALVPFFKRSDVPLLQPAKSRSFGMERRPGPWG
jgi:membrane associated rhomboid family serine protease